MKVFLNSEKAGWDGLFEPVRPLEEGCEPPAQPGLVGTLKTTHRNEEFTTALLKSRSFVKLPETNSYLNLPPACCGFLLVAKRSRVASG